jgi:hypothetical protein
MANPKGKGGFQERPQDINLAGAPKRGQNWQESVKRLSDMTREELIEYIGPKTTIGKMLKELPPNVPMKDALILISFIQYGRDPNPRMLSTLMDREDGKPAQPISGDPQKPLEIVIRKASDAAGTNDK